jgi:hypothetical protein
MSKKNIKRSKTENFLENIQKDNTMIDYMINLRVLNKASQFLSDSNKSSRDGRFVSLAHANEEFTAPVITKGKSAAKAKKPRRRK